MLTSECRDDREPHGMPDPDEVYARHVTELGRTHDVRAREDILSESGLKLIARDRRIEPRVFAQLTRHRLLRPLDHSIAIENCLHPGDLIATARELLREDALVAALVRVLRDPGAPERHLGRMTLIPAMANKLSVMRERLPGHYRHAVRVSLCAAALAEAAGPESAALGIELATAGLLHDIGELHIDPDIFSLKRALTPGEERQVRAHPVIAHMLLSGFPEYDPVVSRAVLEHHERLDGSGYPRGRRAEQLDLPGRILAVAEMAVAVCDRGNGESLAAILKGQPEKYDARVVKVLIDALRHCPVSRDATAQTGPERVVKELGELLAAIESGLEASATRETPAQQRVAERLAAMQRTLDRAGLRLVDAVEWLEVLREDPGLLAELDALARETRYRLRELAIECRHRGCAPSGDGEDRVLTSWLDGLDKPK
ncbi:MAG: HD domain-containing protein [Chromatiales bacterium]|nr:HD domain-containing protein [Chromatiales bacterium]